MKKINKIALNSFGRFHTFDLAEKLNSINKLGLFITAYPSFKYNPNFKCNIERRSWSLLASSLLSRFGISKISNGIASIGIRDYSRWAASLEYNNCEIIHSLASFSLDTFKKYQNSKYKICDRGSTHRLYQELTLKNEFNLIGAKYELNQEMIDRDIEEYELANVILVPSKFVKKTFTSYGIPEDKVKIIPYSMNTDLFYKFKDRFPKNNKSLKIIFVGSIGVRKGAHYIFEAIRNLPDDIQFEFIGHIQPEFSKLAKVVACKNVKFLGAIPRAELLKKYNEADLLILPSLEEGLPLVMLQAILCGLPMLVTEETGIKTLIPQELGYRIITSKSSLDIVNKILHFYHHRNELHLIEKEIDVSFKYKMNNDYVEKILDVYNI